MALAVSNGGGNGKGMRSRAGHSPIAEINVIPLVDVVLVLLIIFMLTAHVMEFGLEIEVPKVTQTRDTAKELPVVSLTRNGDLYLNDKKTNINLLAAAIQQRFPNTKAVYVKADKGTVWDAVAQVFSKLGEAKLDVQAVTQPEESSTLRR